MGNGLIPWNSKTIDKDIGETYATLYAEAYIAKDFKESSYWFKRLWKYGLTLITSVEWDKEPPEMRAQAFTRKSHESYLRSRGKWPTK